MAIDAIVSHARLVPPLLLNARAVHRNPKADPIQAITYAAIGVVNP
jgi:hypothetical protein